MGAGCQSDVIIICCINEDTGEIKLASVYRDTYLNINDEGSYRKINAAYTNGGPQQALKALNKNLDLNITEYITFSWKAVAEGINILGGVDVEITKSEFKFNQWVYHGDSEGYEHWFPPAERAGDAALRRRASCGLRASASYGYGLCQD